MSLKINNIYKSFGDKIVLKNINLEIKDGEFVSLLGASGCGKTTLLKIIAGFERVDSGEITKDDRVFISDNKIFLSPQDRSLNMVFQQFALWPHMNVKKHLEYALNGRNKNINADEDMKYMLEIVGLSGFEDSYPEDLSGGQKQRVALARALITKPEMLLMDEPLSALDANLKIEMRKFIKEIHMKFKTTIIYVTHDQDEALAMSDRIVIIKDGVVEQEGSPYEIYENPKTEYVAKFVGKSNLIRGKWQGDLFVVEDSDIFFRNKSVKENFSNKNLYPIKPDELYISKGGSGISARILSIEYMGTGYEYKLESKHGILNVHSKSSIYRPGEEVKVTKEEVYKNAM